MLKLLFVLVLTDRKIIAGSSDGPYRCGKALKPGPSPKIEERIVGGYDIGYYKYPWYAALVTPDDIVACGGTLITSKIVLTAAHCYKSFMKNHTSSNEPSLESIYRIFLGVYNKCQKEKTQKIFTTEKVHVHEKYKQNVPYYDIALLVLKEDTNGFHPICLPDKVIKEKYGESFAPGLGTLKYKGTTPCTVHEARILLYSDEDCRKMLNKTGNDGKKLQGAFCAGYLQGGIDTCQGDSGGPLQTINEIGQYVLRGIVSFGFDCAMPGYLGVYTDVSQYLDWIYKKVGRNLTQFIEKPPKSEVTQSTIQVEDKPPKKDVTQPSTLPSTDVLISENPPKKEVLQLPINKPISIIFLQGNKLIIFKDRNRGRIKRKKPKKSTNS